MTYEEARNRLDAMRQCYEKKLHGCSCTDSCDLAYAQGHCGEVPEVYAKAVEALDHYKKSIWVRVCPQTDSVECLACRYELQSEELETPYCPWCGAEMTNWNGAED